MAEGARVRMIHCLATEPQPPTDVDAFGMPFPRPANTIDHG